MTALRKLAAAAAVLARQNDPDVLDVAAALDRVVQGLSDSLDAELGLRRRPGERRPTTIARHRERLGWLLAWKRTRWADLAPAPAAAAMHDALIRYQATAWLRERDWREYPAERRGRDAEFCWRILRCGVGAPSAERIRKLLVTN